MARKKWTEKEMLELAPSMSLKCLGIKFVNGHPILELECIRGHKFDQKLGLLKSGKWCPTCTSQPIKIPNEFRAFFSDIQWNEYVHSKIIISYRKMINKRLSQSIIKNIENLVRFQKESFPIDKKPVVPEVYRIIHNFFHFNRIKGVFPMIQAIVYVLLERKFEIPYYPHILMKIKENYYKLENYYKSQLPTDTK